MEGRSQASIGIEIDAMRCLTGNPVLTIHYVWKCAVMDTKIAFT